MIVKFIYAVKKFFNFLKSSCGNNFQQRTTIAKWFLKMLRHEKNHFFGFSFLPLQCCFSLFLSFFQRWVVFDFFSRFQEPNIIGWVWMKKTEELFVFKAFFFWNLTLNLSLKLFIKRVAKMLPSYKEFAYPFIHQEVNIQRNFALCPFTSTLHLCTSIHNISDRLSESVHRVSFESRDKETRN